MDQSWPSCAQEIWDHHDQNNDNPYSLVSKMDSEYDWLSKVGCINKEDHFLLPFMDQMLKQLVEHKYYWFLDGYARDNQIRITPKDQENTTFTCPFRTFAYHCMPFRLCNAPSIFQRCIISIFFDMVEKFLENFIDDFSIFGSTYDKCLYHLQLVLRGCKEKILTYLGKVSSNWKYT